jgi:dUTP pyrophosphatase
MILKVKKLHKDAVIPSAARPGDVGLDLTATRIGAYDNITQVYTYHTGIAVEIPEGYVGLIMPRSSIANQELSLANSVGVIDQGYRGELIVKFRCTSDTPLRYYGAGERVAQLVIVPAPKVMVSVVRELSSTERGEYGFGSTGN